MPYDETREIVYAAVARGLSLGMTSEQILRLGKLDGNGT